MKKIIWAVFTIVIFYVVSVPVYAHPGKTDGSGGHYNRSTGEYHYHHGYTAHQHVDMNGDGILDCPYNYVDKTVQNSDSLTYIKSSYLSSTTVTLPEENNKERSVTVEVMPQWAKLSIISMAVGCLIMIAIIKSKNRDIMLFKKAKSDLQEKYESEVARSQSLSEECNSLLQKLNSEKANARFEVSAAREQANKEIEHEKQRRINLYREMLDNSLIEEMKHDLGNEYLLILSDAPSRIEFDKEGLPHKYENGVDIFSFYVSASGKYHRSTCRYAKSGSIVHAVEISKHKYKYTQCGICQPLIPDLFWLTKYQQYKKQFEKPSCSWKDII